MSSEPSKTKNVAKYNAVHSYFIGPKGANMPDFRANINAILDELLDARLSYYPDDKHFIPKDVRRSKTFLQVGQNLRLATQKAAQLLGEHSAPFWSPRYQAHMCTDLTMSSLLGYFMTMLYNPNNVALEASPMTTLVELRVGRQLCKMFGYCIGEEEDEPEDENKTKNGKEKEKEKPLAWGHITCDGTVANLESIWVARNIKFYPLSLFQAVTKGSLQHIAEDFKVAPCGEGKSEKPFKDMDTWELLNLQPETVLNLPEILYNKFGITSKFLETALNDYNIQTVGLKKLENDFKIEKPMQYFVGKTRHYSWPKGAAIAGLGSGTMTGVESCVDNKQAVYAVVAIIGSTEEGAVDRLSEIVELRKKFQKKGLSFLIHADAAWGGYFATMLSRNEPPRGHPTLISGPPEKELDPELYLDEETRCDLEALKDADSITVDPHKAGYIPYPAGSLVYRDGRMRHLVTWGSPYLSQGSADNISIYGVEGSKPGASAMSTWFSNLTLGLHNRGYGSLLAEATYTSARLSAYYATMVNDDFICVPFNMLQSEEDGKIPYTGLGVEEERKLIRKLIINKPDEDIKKDEDAMAIIRRLGSDTNINAFALNWKYEDQTLNTDLEEANYFMKSVVDRLSIVTANTDPGKIPIILTSTKFSSEDYGLCMEKFVERLGIPKAAQPHQSLFVLRNVVMSPFPTYKEFIDVLMKDFQKVIREEVKVCRERNKRDKKETAQFLVQGSPTGSEVFLVFQTSFHSANRRQQIILKASLDETLHSEFERLRADRKKEIMLESYDILSIEKTVKSIAKGHVPLKAKIYEKTNETRFTLGSATLNFVVKSRPLNSANRDIHYPQEFMPFYLYGTGRDDMHISHMLLKAPNISLAASNITFQPDLGQEVVSGLEKGLILTFSTRHEASMQPFPSENKSLPESFFFHKGAEFDVKVWKDPMVSKDSNKGPIKGPGLLKGLKKGNELYDGKVKLGDYIAVDAEGPNADPFEYKQNDSTTWHDGLEEIGKMLNGTYLPENQ